MKKFIEALYTNPNKGNKKAAEAELAGRLFSILSTLGIILSLWGIFELFPAQFSSIEQRLSGSSTSMCRTDECLTPDYSSAFILLSVGGLWSAFFISLAIRYGRIWAKEHKIGKMAASDKLAFTFTLFAAAIIVFLLAKFTNWY